MSTETQESVSDWAEETFGPAGSDARVAARVSEELAELLEALVDGEWEKATAELADCMIIMARLGVRLGVKVSFSVAEPANLGPIKTFVKVNRQMAALLRALTLVELTGTNTSYRQGLAPVIPLGPVLLSQERMKELILGMQELAASLGCDLQQAVDLKMKINRARRWKLDGSGHGYHVRGEDCT